MDETLDEDEQDEQEIAELECPFSKKKRENKYANNNEKIAPVS